MAVISTQVNDIVKSIEAVPNCEQLEAIAQKYLASWVKQMEDAIKAKVSAEAKKVAPTDLGSVISWISNLVSEAEADYTKATALIAELTSSYATVLAAITNKISSMECSMPSIPTLPTP